MRVLISAHDGEVLSRVKIVEWVKFKKLLPLGHFCSGQSMQEIVRSRLSGVILRLDKSM